MVHPAGAAAEGEPPPPPPPPHEGQRVMPTPFLTKTYQLVDDPSIDDVISWNEDGSTFVVWRSAEFARDILPKYFKHNNFSSFVRQLNTYGFRKIVPDRWEFSNECFRRGEKQLLCDIHRRKISPTPATTVVPAAAPPNQVGSPVNSGDEQALSTTSSPGGVHPAPATAGSSGGGSELAEENTRLRRENRQLSRELGQMKSLCNNILDLMSKYSPGQQNGEAAAALEGGGGASTSRPLELALGRSTEEEEEEETAAAARAEGSSGGTRLFGVSIGFKRNRGEDGGAASRSAPDVKMEPLDGVTEG